jgi:hypothetical protein
VCPRIGAFRAARTFGCVPGLFIGLLLLGKPIIAWGVWVPLVKLTEFFQTAQGEVVEGLLRPVSTIREVKPFDEVENTTVVSAPSFDTGHDFIDVVFLTLFDIVRFPKYL